VSASRKTTTSCRASGERAAQRGGLARIRCEKTRTRESSAATALALARGVVLRAIINDHHFDFGPRNRQSSTERSVSPRPCPRYRPR
jgi:hypothetical protein